MSFLCSKIQDIAFSYQIFLVISVLSISRSFSIFHHLDNFEEYRSGIL